jgi:hypothetical protein
MRSPRRAVAETEGGATRTQEQIRRQSLIRSHRG